MKTFNQPGSDFNPDISNFQKQFHRKRVELFFLKSNERNS